MKESGYESSSGQYRTNGGYPRPMAAFANDDDDEPSPPLVTAGDKLLQQMQRKNSMPHLVPFFPPLLHIVFPFLCVDFKE